MFTGLQSFLLGGQVFFQSCSYLITYIVTLKQAFALFISYDSNIKQTDQIRVKNMNFRQTMRLFLVFWKYRVRESIIHQWIWLKGDLPTRSKKSHKNEMQCMLVPLGNNHRICHSTVPCKCWSRLDFMS